MFAGMVIDQGPFYIARRQAQNAADAGALAGAIELNFFGTNAMATANKYWLAMLSGVGRSKAA